MSLACVAVRDSVDCKEQLQLCCVLPAPLVSCYSRYWTQYPNLCWPRNCNVPYPAVGTTLTLFVAFFNWDREAEQATARVKEAHRNHRLESGLDAA